MHKFKKIKQKINFPSKNTDLFVCSFFGRRDGMASEFIKSVLEAEEEFKKKELEVSRQAEEKKQKAKIDSAKLLSDSHKQVEKMLEDDRQAISISTRQRLEKEKKNIDEECAELSKTAEKNLDRVTELVMRSFARH